MALKYRTPGVTVKEYSTNNVAPLIATSDTPCLVGPAPGSIERTEAVTLRGSSTPRSINAVLSNNGVTVTFQTTAAHNLIAGYEVKIQGFTPTGYNGVYTVISVPSTTTFVVSCSEIAAASTFGTYYNVATIPLVYESDPSTAVMTSSSIKSVKAVDPTRAVNADTNYNSSSGYAAGSYIFDPSTRTLARNATIPTATLSGTITNNQTTITAKGNPDLFSNPKGRILIDQEEIEYTSIGFSGEQQIVTITNETNPGSSTVAVTVGDVAGLTVTTNAGNTAATLSDTTGLAINTTYTISSSTIPAADNITFTTGGTLSTSITLSSGTNVTAGTTQAATISTSRILNGVNTAWDSSFVNSEITISSTTYKIGRIISTTRAVIDSTATPITTTISATGSYTIKKAYTLTFNDTTLNNTSTITTASIQPSATSTQVRNALGLLTSVGGNSNVGVSGSSGGPYTITFQGDLGGTDVAGLTSSNPTSITITSTDGTFTFQGCARGQYGTVAATHNTNAQISQTTTIADGADVYVNFTYTPGDYYDGLKFTNLNDVERRFGAAYKVQNRVITGEIESPLTLAANLAFENGATEIVIQPIFIQDGATKRAPTNTEVINGAAWRAALESLRAVEGIGVIVPVIGQTQAYTYGTNASASLTDQGQLSILQVVQDHIHYQQVNNDQYMIGVFGEDGTNPIPGQAYAAPDTLRNHAQVLKARYGGQHAENVVLLAPSQFNRSLPTGNSQVKLGGQYAAAAIAGMIVSRPVSSTLTRRFMSGFDNVLVTRNKSEKITDSSYGLFVIEQVGRAIQIRHAITLDDANSARQELSVVRAKQKLINSIRLTIDTQIIGKVIADNNAPLVVASAVANTLSILVSDGDIVDFNNVQSRIVTLSPTVIEVRFAYRPSFPVNYVDVAFSIDLTGGVATLTDTTNNINSGAI